MQCCNFIYSARHHGGKTDASHPNVTHENKQRFIFSAEMW